MTEAEKTAEVALATGYAYLAYIAGTLTPREWAQAAQDAHEFMGIEWNNPHDVCRPEAFDGFTVTTLDEGVCND